MSESRSRGGKGREQEGNKKGGEQGKQIIKKRQKVSWEGERIGKKEAGNVPERRGQK